MGIFSRLFGNNKKTHNLDINKPATTSQIIVNTQLVDNLVFIVLFDKPVCFSIGNLLSILKQYSPEMATCRITEMSVTDKKQWLIAWDQHIIELSHCSKCVSKDILDICVGPAAYAQEEKLLAFKHQDHVELRYVGYEANALRQYIALTYVAVALGEQEAITIINERAHTSLPISYFLAEPPQLRLEYINSLPLLALFCGFIKYNVPGSYGTWLRTYGASRIELPDLAVRLDPLNQTSFYYNLFLMLYCYIQDTGAKLKVGDNVEISDNQHIYLRSAKPDEFFLENDGLLLVMEFDRPI